MGEDAITFLIAPGACPDDPVAAKLLQEHEAEAARQGAEFWNYGWVLSDDAVSSKTSKGFLFSQIDPETMDVTHTWETYEDYEERRRLKRERLLRMASEADNKPTQH
jgi:hypothetical protein